jgi:hypothetical protein
MSNEDEETLLEWGPDEVKMFHDLKHANLLDPWRDMVDRAIKLMTGVEAVDEDWCDNYPAYVAHLEVQALHIMDSRREAFNSDYQSRKQSRPRRGYD